MKNLLLLGDSIRVGYCEFVKDMLKDEVEVFFPPENCRFAQYVLRNFGDWLNACWDDRAAVCVAGLMSFVGLLVPHAVRRLAGGAAAQLLYFKIIRHESAFDQDGRAADMRGDVKSLRRRLGHAPILRVKLRDQVLMTESAELFAARTCSIQNLCAARLAGGKIILVDADEDRSWRVIDDLRAAHQILMLAVFCIFAADSVVLARHCQRLSQKLRQAAQLYGNGEVDVAFLTAVVGNCSAVKASMPRIDHQDIQAGVR